MKKTVLFVLLKCLLSSTAIAIVFIDIFVPNANVGYTSILLLIIAMLPWIGNFKSLELFNLGKIEFFSKEQEKNIKVDSKELEHSYKFAPKNVFLYTDNVPLILAQLRIELEKRLNLLCQQNSINECEYKGIGKTAEILYKKGILNSQERNLIQNLLPAMNNAIHGKLDDKYSEKYEWVLNVAETLLGSLDKKLCNSENKK